MSFPIVVILILLLLGGGALLFLKGHSQSPKAASQAPQKRLSPHERRKQLNDATLSKLKSSKQYWGACIEIDHQSQCCEAVMAIRQEPFSFDKLPDLPLAMCDQSMCMCHYLGVKERRADNRRTGHDRREEIRFDPNSGERRSGNDRRKTQDVWLHHDQDG